MYNQKNANFLSCQIGTSRSVKQHKLRRHIAALANKTGKTLISLYITYDTKIEQVIVNLKKESEQAVAKSEKEKEFLQNTLKGLIQHLRQHQETPEYGLALFAGNFFEAEKEVLSIDEIIPPEPLTACSYTVDERFQLEPLREMLRDQKVVGILAMDAKQASFGLLNGERLEFLEDISSGVAGKTGKGGQSQRRYERERDMELSYFFHRIAEHATKAFMENGVNVLIAGGPGQTKNDFLKGDYLHYELSNMLLNVVDTQSADKEAIREVLAKSSEALNNMCGPEEKKIVDNLMAELRKPNGLATYGLDAVIDALNKGQAKIALATDNTNAAEVFTRCKKCSTPKTAIAYDKTQAIKEMTTVPCDNCGNQSYEVKEKDIIDVLEDLASKTDASVEVISSPSKEKDEVTALGGIAALLRYKTG
jgi:peptide chain release factor subunit 1